MLDQFPHDPDVIHLNHAGVGPWPRRAVEAVSRFAEENLRRGSLAYPAWLELEGRLRERLARLINAPSPADVSLLKSTSEGLSLVAHGLAWRPGENVVCARQEFPSNRIVWESLARHGVEVRLADLAGGESPEEALLSLCDERTRLLAVSAVQYADGLRMDLARLGRECRGREILFCVDAIQQLGALRFDAQAVDADFVVADGHKWLLGAEGLALFYCRAGLREELQLHQYGWHMVEALGDFERPDWRPAPDGRRFECGSPNLLGAHALEASLALLEEIGMARVEERVLGNNALLRRLIAAHPELEPLSPAAPERRAGIVTFRHRGIEGQELYRRLMAQNVLCAARGGGVRFSPHFYTDEERLQRAVELAASGEVRL